MGREEIDFVKLIQEQIDMVRNYVPPRYFHFYNLGTGVPDEIVIEYFNGSNVVVVTEDETKYLNGELYLEEEKMNEKARPKMTAHQKTILYNLILIQVMKNMPIPRGSGKSLLYWDNLWRYHAFKQTEYCLAAIGETMVDILPEDHPARDDA